MRILHAGSGGEPLPAYLEGGANDVVTVDIDPGKGPDIVGDIRDLGDIGSFDVVYCSHTLEHLSWSDVDRALREFRRVLLPGGVLIVWVPDLDGVRPTEEVVFVSPAGPITGVDLYWGHRESIDRGAHAMTHKSGFVAETLRRKLEGAGFPHVEVKRVQIRNLVGIARRD